MLRLLIVAPCVLALAGCNQTTLSDPPPPEIVTMGAFRGKQNNPLAPASVLRKLTAEEKKILHKGFANGLKDPESARFQWTQIAWQPEGTIHYCAMVNGKNSYGGYTGFQPFIGLITVANGKIIGGVIGAVGSRDVEKFLVDECRKYGLNPYEIADEG